MGDIINQTIAGQGIGNVYVSRDCYIGTGTRRLQLQAGRPLPEHPAPSHYLVAEHEVVPFSDRGDLLRELDEWASSDKPVRVRLLTGPGGAGKTRLALKWISHCHARGEKAGFVRTLDDDAIQAIAEEKAVIVVVDYAETREALPDLLRELASRRDSPCRIRVLLLARGVGDWWNEICRRDGAVEWLLHDSPGPRGLPAVEEADRAAEFGHAARAFATLRGWAAVPSVPDLGDDRFARTLYLHMAAWQAGEGERASAEELPDRLLDHEARFWLNEAGFELKRKSEKKRQFRKDAETAVAALVLLGGARDSKHLKRILSATGDKKTRLRLAEMLRTLYPGAGDLLIAPLEPDLLGEALIIRLLRDKDRPEWLGEAVKEANTEELRRTFTVLARAEGLNPELAEAAQRHLLAVRGEERALPAFQALLGLSEHTAHARLGLVLADALEHCGTSVIALAFEPLLPRHTVQMREVALWTYRCLCSQPSTPAVRALYLNNMGNRLSDLRRWKDAVNVMAEAVDIRRSLVGEGDDTALLGLATSLTNLGWCLYNNPSQRQEALAPALEAIGYHRTLAYAELGAPHAGLANGLAILGIILAGLDRRADAIQVTREAIDHLERLSAERPDTFLPLLAGYLTNLGGYLGESGDLDEALPPAQRAAEIYRGLARKNPDAFQHPLAAILGNLGCRYSELGRHNEAISLGREALELYQRLYEQRPETFRVELANVLNNLGNHYFATGNSEEGMAATSEAVQLRRFLVDERPDGSVLDLVQSLNNLGLHLSSLGWWDEALAATGESIARCLSAPADATVRLALALKVHGDVLARMGRYDEAFAMTSQSVAQYFLAMSQKANHVLPELACALCSLGIRFSEQNRHDEGVAAVTMAIGLNRDLARRSPATHMRSLADSLNNLGSRLAAAGHHSQALEYARESVELYAGLLGQGPRPRRVRIAYARSLSNLGLRLLELGGLGAIEPTELAVEQYRALLTEQPGELIETDLARSLCGYGKALVAAGRSQEAGHALQEATERLWPHFLNRPRAHAWLANQLIEARMALLDGAEPPRELAERGSMFRQLVVVHPESSNEASR